MEPHPLNIKGGTEREVKEETGEKDEGRMEMEVRDPMDTHCAARPVITPPSPGKSTIMQG